MTVRDPLPFRLTQVPLGDARVASDPAELLALSRSQREPVLFKGIGRDWPATRRWDLPWLRSYFGARELPVAWNPERVFHGMRGAALPQAQRETRLEFRQAPAADIFDAFEHPPNPYYLSALPLGDEPALLDDMPFFAAHSEEFARLLWISSPGHVTPTHFDAHPSLFAQIHGSKRFVLFAPEAFSALYPYGVDHPQARYSRLFDLSAPDFERFPEARELEGYDAQVDAGDLLLLPAFWWHAVSSVALSVSVSFPLNHEPFPRFEELMGYWDALHTLLASALPSDIPPSMRTYALRLLLFPPEFSSPRA